MLGLQLCVLMLVSCLMASCLPDLCFRNCEENRDRELYCGNAEKGGQQFQMGPDVVIERMLEPEISWLVGTVGSKSFEHICGRG